MVAKPAPPRKTRRPSARMRLTSIGIGPQNTAFWQQRCEIATFNIP